MWHGLFPSKKYPDYWDLRRKDSSFTTIFPLCSVAFHVSPSQSLLRLETPVSTETNRRVSLLCDVVFSASSHISNMITTQRSAVSSHGIANYLSFGKNSQARCDSLLFGVAYLYEACNRSSFTIVLELVITAVEHDWDCEESCMQQGGVIPLFSIHTKQREDKGKILSQPWYGAFQCDTL